MLYLKSRKLLKEAIDLEFTVLVCILNCAYQVILHRGTFYIQSIQLRRKSLKIIVSSTM